MGCLQSQNDPLQQNQSQAGQVKKYIESDQVKKKQIFLLGDSTLDNVSWLKSSEKSIKFQLQDLLDQKEYEVINLAADGFTTNDVLTGTFPSISYQDRLNSGDPFPIKQYQSFQPLVHLENLIKQNQDNQNYNKNNKPIVILSIGGNDIRVNLQRGMSAIMQSQQNLVQNYMSILNHLKNNLLIDQIIIQNQYKPCIKQDQHYQIYKIFSMVNPKEPMAVLNQLLFQTYNNEINEFAQQNLLPILDLSNSFDPYDESLYCTQIEPSFKGGKEISALAAYIIKNHTFEKSLIYQKPGKGKIITLENKGPFQIK